MTNDVALQGRKQVEDREGSMRKNWRIRIRVRIPFERIKLTVELVFNLNWIDFES